MTNAEYLDPDERTLPGSLLWILILAAGLVVIVVLLLRRMGGGAAQNVFALRTSKAREADESSKVRLDDIGGCVEAKRELQDIVSYLKAPQK